MSAISAGCKQRIERRRYRSGLRPRRFLLVWLDGWRPLGSRRSAAKDAFVNDRQTRQQPPHPRPARQRDHGQELDHRSRGADADEQPRRRGRRGPAEPGRLWRHRPRRAQLAMLRQDRRDAGAARGRPDPARPVGQAGRRVPHAQGRAASAHRQLQPRAQMGELGGVQRARSQGAHDVRPDDRRQLDLHRHARASSKAPTRPSSRWAASIMAATSRASGS